MERIGRYEVIQELGRGSMGAVYKARDPQIGRVVAVKIILTANLSPTELEQYKQRFHREAQAAGQMSHPGIVTIHDIAEDNSGQPYLVMEFIEGTALDRLLAPPAERLPLAQSFDIGIQVAQALDYAHRRGVIHRDIKPANILVAQDGRAKIADFGIAKLAGAQLTQAGQLMGTPAFMSPEQFSGGAVDARSDLFSLGATLYWMFTGEKPFAGDTLTAVSFKVVYTAPVPARQLNPALPAGLDTALARCLAKTPADRYPTCHDLAADLEAIKWGKTIAAAPLPAAPVEQTVAAVPQSGTAVEKTLAAEPTLREISMVGAPTRPGAPAKLQSLLQLVLTRKLAAISVGAALLLLLVLGGYWLKPTQKQKTEPPAATTASTPVAESTPSPAPPAPPPPRARPPKVVPMSALRVRCQHNFRSAKLEIFADDKPVLDTTLRGEEENLGVMKIFRGLLETSRPVPAGRHTLRVRVSSRAEDYEEEEVIRGTFPERGSRTLRIEFGKGSALGVVERKLTLSWH